MSRVLVYTPLHPSYGIRKRSLESIMELSFTGYMTLTFGKSAPKDPTEGNANILAKYQEAQMLALEGGYDYLMTIEADNIVPKIALERLMSLDADVAYGLYCSRQDHRWLIFEDVQRMKATRLKMPYLKECWGYAVPSTGLGFGCTLIKTQVFEQVSMRLDDGGPGPDWWFAIDCRKKGYNQFTDLGCIVGHQLDNHVIIYPDPWEPNLYRTEMI